MLVAFAAFLGAGGLAFGYFVALPAAVHFLTNYDSHLYAIQIRAQDYSPSPSVVLFAVTIVFETPIVILGLVRLGVLSSAKLRTQPAHRLLRRWRPSRVALPGVDPITTMMEMVPLMLLFEGSIWLSVLLERRQAGALGRRYSERPMARAAVKAKAKQGKAGAQPAKAPARRPRSGAGTRAAVTRTRTSSS